MRAFTSYSSDPLVAAAQAILIEAKVPTSKALTAIWKLSPDSYPKKSDVQKVYKQFAIADEIYTDGKGLFCHPEVVGSYTSASKAAAAVSRSRKAFLESADVEDDEIISEKVTITGLL